MKAIRQRKSAEERRREIIETALRLAAISGPDHVTTEAIATAIGVTQPAVFRHFPRKDDIWLAVSEWLQGEMRERWAHAEAGAATPEQRLLAVVHAQLQLVDCIPALPTILFTWQLNGERTPLQDVISRLMRHFHGRLSGIFRDSGGALSADADRAAWLVISIVQGTAIRWTLMRRSFDLAEEGAALAKLALAGLRGTQDED